MQHSRETNFSFARFWRSTYWPVFLGCILTLVAMASYNALPQKRQQLVPAGKVEANIHVDGKNSAHWLDRDALRWRCALKQNHNNAFCQFSLHVADDELTGVDLSSYTHMKLGLKYFGSSSRLRFYYRNHIPGFSTPGDHESAVFNQANVPVNALADGLILRMDEFYVAEWWSDAYQAPRHLNSPRFSNVLTFGIDLAFPAEPGPHDFQLHSAELVGVWVRRDQWYGGILLLWVFGLATVGGVKYLRLRHSVALERRRLNRLQAQAARLKDQSERFRELSRHDELTGLLNRHGLSEGVARCFKGDRAVSLLIADIDHFKPINDRFGHNAGDQVLRELGQLLAEHIRQTDYAARWGGEEFVLLLPDTELGDAVTIAEKLRSLVANHPFDVLPGQPLTLSLGVGARVGNEAYEALLKRVDQALYQAKHDGRDRIVLAHNAAA